jgi:hypothetical protein
MKFYFSFICLLAIVFISCGKKDRVCSCTVATSGTITTHSQSSAITYSLNLGLPLPIPPLEITQAKDTTIVTPVSYADTRTVNYAKISKRNMETNCPKTFEETYHDGSTTIIPGSSTVTATEAGKKTYMCEIE